MYPGYKSRPHIPFQSPSLLKRHTIDAHRLPQKESANTQGPTLSPLQGLAFISLFLKVSLNNCEKTNSTV